MNKQEANKEVSQHASKAAQGAQGSNAQQEGKKKRASLFQLTAFLSGKQARQLAGNTRQPCATGNAALRKLTAFL